MSEKTTTVRIDIKNRDLIHEMSFVAGMLESAAILKKLPSSARGTPGVELSISSILAEAHEWRARSLVKCMAEIARAGHDLGRYKSVSLDPANAQLVCEFYDADLFSAADEDADA